MRDLPAGFMWGSATSAHQVEGCNTNNDWWDWEHAAGTLAVQPSGDAIDHRNRYDADFALLASLGHNAHRMSVEWSRIEPSCNEFSVSAIDHYRRVLESMAARGLTAFVTLYHKTLPRWFAQRGGWAADGSLELFGRYASFVAQRLGDLVTYACTINEPQILPLFGYVTGQFPPGRMDRSLAVEVNRRLIDAHRVAVQALRAGSGTPLVGTCLQLVPLEPLRPEHEGDVTLTRSLRELMTESHLDDLRGGGDVGDWVGLQYYTRAGIDSRLPLLVAPPRSGAETTQMGWEVYPAGFGQMLRRVAETGLPVVVTENGIATADDRQRIAYLSSHLRELKNAIDDGVDVRGYLYWSAFDNFEWNHGYAPTFGLVAIDRSDNLRRIPRPSAYAYGRLAASGDLRELS